MFGQEDLQSMQFLWNTFDVIKPVNSNDEFHTLEFPLKRCDALLYLGFQETFSELLGVDANWECSNGDYLALKFNAVRRRRQTA